jgi:hypothetical protein
MWRLVMTVSSYDEELVTISVVEEDADLLIKELMGGQDTMTHGGSLLLSSFDGGN